LRSKFLIALVAVAALAVGPALAQSEFTGNLFVTVKGDDGNAISGAAVKLIGPDFTRESTTDPEGKCAFIKLPPSQNYELEISARGYNTSILQGVRIETLANPEMIITLNASTTEERVVVTAETPLLDKRKTGTTTIVNADELEQIPTARDPWAVLTTIPGIATDRVNVAGNESGQQSQFAGKGDGGFTSTWVMDGVEFTDNAAEGASSTYFDFNSFENIGFVTGGADVEQITPGLRFNFVTKQGTNRTSGTIGMTYTDSDLQDQVPVTDNPEWVVDAGGAESFAGNGINEVFEKNFDIGGPIVKDWLWYWAGYTQNDIDTSVGGTPDRTKLKNISAKIHGQFNEGHTNYRAWITEGDKIKDGRGASETRPLPTTWDQSGPSPIYSASISHFFGSNLELSAQWGNSEGGFQLIPKGGVDSQIVLDEFGVWQNSFFQYVINRPVKTTAIRGNWFTNGFGWEHELKFGVRYKETRRETVSTYPGGVVAFQGEAGLGGSVNLYRDGLLRDETYHTNVWIGDTAIKGPWAITLGVNYSTQEGEQLEAQVPGNVWLDSIGEGDRLPGITGEQFDPGLSWDDLLPRVGVTYTFGGKQRLLVRGSYAQFVDQLANGDVSFGNPVGPGYLAYPWDDLNYNTFVDPGEVDLDTLLFAYNVDPDAPGDLTRSSWINRSLDAPKVDEILVGAEYELAKNFTVGATITARKRDRDLHAPLYDATQFDYATGDGVMVPLNGGSYYDCTNTVNGTFPDGSGNYSVPYCALSDEGAAATSILRGQMLDNRPGYTQDYMGFEITATKRLSNRWMARAFFAYNDWKQNWSGQPLASNWDMGSNQIATVITGIDGDPTNTQGGTADDGGQVGYPSAGSGAKDDIWLGTSNWQANINFLYQLPKGYSVSTNIQGRQGYAVPYYDHVTVVDPDGISQTKQVQIGAMDGQRYDDLFLMDVKLAKTFRFESNTAVELSFEVFNLFDQDTILQTGRRVDSASQFLRVREVLSPRIMRFGATVTF